MQAPHVFLEGHACLGNAQEVLPQLVANLDIDLAAAYAIQFIESVNTADAAGAAIGNWPLAKEQPVQQEKKDVATT